MIEVVHQETRNSIEKCALCVPNAACLIFPFVPNRPTFGDNAAYDRFATLVGQKTRSPNIAVEICPILVNFRSNPISCLSAQGPPTTRRWSYPMAAKARKTKKKATAKRKTAKRKSSRKR